MTQMTESHVLLVKTNKSVTNKHCSIYHGFQLQILVNDPNEALFMRITWNQWTDRVDDALIDKIFEYKKNVCHWYERYTNVKRDMLLRSTWKWQLLTTFSHVVNRKRHYNNSHEIQTIQIWCELAPGKWQQDCRRDNEARRWKSNI